MFCHTTWFESIVASYIAMRRFAAHLFIGLGWIVGVTIGSFGGFWNGSLSHFLFGAFSSKVI